jgi:hypothetical protein
VYSSHRTISGSSGQFVLDLIPHSSNPQIILALCGTQAGGRSGVSIRALAEGFKLRGDKGTKVPTIELSQVKVSATVRVTMNTRYTIHNARWQCAPKDFKLELLSFRGTSACILANSWMHLNTWRRPIRHSAQRHIVDLKYGDTASEEGNPSRTTTGVGSVHVPYGNPVWLARSI